MNRQEFIHKNVTAELVRLGYDQNTALSGADAAIDYYHRKSHLSSKGKIFEDCLNVAKQWAGKRRLGMPNAHK
ncbi:hypothetical protein PT300_00035 [Enterobacteriaceae bacterium ESL0689]|nr:hypothetical protein [Enterobacteriaceae bacterium ESL0689]